ncbi:MAG TPA: ABC transporter substrate-binding protein [Anaerolineales bacterium]|nr:ABC transporter substrate-binding protein [Anaerolineales bacterium]
MNRKYDRLLMGVFLAVLFALGLSSCEPEETRIGVVSAGLGLDDVYEGFKVGMVDLGYVEDENITYSYPNLGDTSVEEEEREQIASELIESGVDLLLSMGTAATISAKNATDGTELPVVFAPVTDPVDAKLMEDPSSPGGNLTGVTNGGSESRRLEWLRDLSPETIKEIYVVYNSDDQSALVALATAEETAAKLGVSLITEPVTSDEAMVEAILQTPEEADAIFMLPEVMAVSHTADFVALALERKLPLAGPTTTQVEDGALVSYGLNLFEAGKQAARLADQILRGADPGTLPVEEAEFQLAINLDTAAAIGLDIPDEIINQANQVFRE